MVGKNCVAIASDTRLGAQAMTVDMNFPKIFPMTDHTMIGLAGLATDVLTLRDQFKYKVKMYHLKEDRVMAPRTLAHVVSSTLYEKRFGPYFVEPIVAGLDPRTHEPFICCTDTIGCIDFAKDFVVVGNATENLYGMCEGLWEPNLEPEDLFETISQALLNAVDRNALAGWGAVVHVITPERVITRNLKARCD
ncbi:proteasome core particle subunit beta 3 [Tieghemiomyces parasiticus]|uniref:Proteasome core particle subunit beta 3 n=1 Tax=Tieghemiomyces parasiticus TaxID=78921 RepID=A0A9W8DL06_9FUNG|nr:proteasome core particle subunit beta 3 [Tieghemiomyces parasiticus]KAJ1922779.1 proteasome core particle subunit beta 3 [Tieghemiomyces parasiticus]